MSYALRTDQRLVTGGVQAIYGRVPVYLCKEGYSPCGARVRQDEGRTTGQALAAGPTVGRPAVLAGISSVFSHCCLLGGRRIRGLPYCRISKDAGTQEANGHCQDWPGCLRSGKKKIKVQKAKVKKGNLELGT